MSSVVANVIAMLAAKLMPPVFAFAVHVGVARLAGAEMLGQYVHLLALLMIFQAMAGAGMQFLITREIAAHPERAETCVRDGRTFGLISGGIATALFVANAAVLLPPAERAPAYVLALTILPSAWIAVQESIFIATRSHHWIAVTAVVENSLKMGLAIVSLLAGYGLLAVCVGIATARLGGLIAGQIALRRAGLPDSWRLDFAATRPFARALVPFALMFVLSMVYFRIDVPVVQALAGTHATAFYGAGATLFGAFLLLPESLMATAYPRLAARGASSGDGYAQTTWLVAKVLTLALTPLSLVLICFADVIVGAVYGPGFLAGAAVLRVLALSLPLHALNGALGQSLQARGEQHAMVYIIMTAVGVHIALSVTLVRLLGIHGAAIAMVASSSFVAIGATIALHRRIAPVRLRLSTLLAFVPIVGPLALAVTAPAEWRMPVLAIGLLWLALGSLWHGTLSRAEVSGVLAALGSSRPREVAA